MPVHKMKTRCVNFPRHTPQISYHSNIFEQAVIIATFCYESDLPLVESLAKINPGTLVKMTKSAYFCMCASTYFLQTGHKISVVTGPKFKNFVHDVEGLSWSLLRVEVLRSYQPFSNANTNNEGGERKHVAVSRDKIG